MTAFQASGTDSLYLDQYFNPFWFLISKFLSLSGGAWVPKVPIATTPMSQRTQWEFFGNMEVTIDLTKQSKARNNRYSSSVN